MARNDLRYVWGLGCTATVLWSAFATASPRVAPVVPLLFVAPPGPRDPARQLVANGHGLRVTLGSRATVVSSENDPTRSLRVTIVGAKPARYVADGEATRVTALRGDRATQVHGEAGWQRVRADAVLPGIDVVQHTDGGGVELDFVVHPGADPSRLRLRLDGQSSLRVVDDGRLLAELGGETIAIGAPRVFQVVDGASKLVDARYVLERDGRTVRIAVADYDANRELVVDPTIGWASYLTASIEDRANATVVAPDGDYVVVGHTASTTFSATSGAFQPALAGSGHGDAFVAKIAADGSKLAYATFLGGSRDDEAYGVAVASDGSVIVVGATRSPDFPVVGGTAATAPGNDPGDLSTPPDLSSFAPTSRAFVAKLSPDGSTLTYSRTFGGTASDAARAVGVDGAGNAIVLGQTTSADFQTTNPLQASSGGGVDSFLATFSPSGALVRATYIGGSGDDLAHALAIDSSGAAVLVGSTTSTDFPAVGAQLSGPFPVGTGFVAKVSPGGASLAFSTFLGGSVAPSSLDAVALDPSGDVIVAGREGSGDFVGLPFSPGFVDDAVVARVKGDGSSVVWANALGGIGHDAVRGVGVDAQGIVHVVGETASHDFPNVKALTNDGGGTMFVSADGSAWAPRMRGVAPASGLPPRPVSVASFVPIASGVMSVTSDGLFFDGGGVWFGVDYGPNDGAPPEALAVDDPLKLGTMAVSTVASKAHVVNVSTDQGASWTSSAAFPTNVTAISALTIDSAAPSTILAGTDQGLFRSTDGGKTFAPVATPGLGVIAAIAHLPSGLWLAGGATQAFGGTAAIAYSADGATWLTAGGYVGSTTVHAFAVTPSGVLAAEGDGVGGFGSGNVLTSVDGKTWASGDAFQLAVLSVASEPANPSAVYAGTSDGVYRSLDGGTTWQEQHPSGLGGTQIGALAVGTAPDGTSLVYAGAKVDTSVPASGGLDGFLASISADGTTVLDSTFYGGTGADSLAAVAVQGNGNLYAVGTTRSNDIASTPGAVGVKPSFSVGTDDSSGAIGVQEVVGDLTLAGDLAVSLAVTQCANSTIAKALVTVSNIGQVAPPGVGLTIPLKWFGSKLTVVQKSGPPAKDLGVVLYAYEALTFESLQPGESAVIEVTVDVSTVPQDVDPYLEGKVFALSGLKGWPEITLANNVAGGYLEAPSCKASGPGGAGGSAGGGGMGGSSAGGSPATGGSTSSGGGGGSTSIGGSPSSAGMGGGTSTGGATGAGGSAHGGSSTSSGGSSATAGGTAADTGGTPASASPADAPSSHGCSKCSIGGPHAGGRPWIAVGGILFGAALLRRRRRD